MAQMPTVQGLEEIYYMQALLKDVGLGADIISQVSSALNALNTDYVSGATLSGAVSNTISHALRQINPRSFHGVKLEYTNLQHLASGLQIAGAMYTLYDFAIGAALQEALAGDLARARLVMIQAALEQRRAANHAFDPIILEALKLAEHNLIRSEDYFGALMVELSDRRQELVGVGLKIGIAAVKKDAVPMLAKFYKGQGLGAKAAATKATSVAGLYAFSLYATYETIVAVLEQHKLAQTAVTSATLADMLAMEIRDRRMEDIPEHRMIQHQAEYSYYDFMVKISSGLLPGFHDLVSVGSGYRDMKNHFTDLRDRTALALMDLDLQTRSVAPSRTGAGQTIIAVVDSSGSMTQTDPRKLRIEALNLLLDSLGEKNTLGLIEFSGRARVLSEPHLLGPMGGSAREELRRQVQAIGASGRTNIKDALIMALDLAKGQTDGLVLVLLSDGEDTSQHQWKGEADFIPPGVPVHVIALSDLADLPSLTRLTQATGGILEVANFSGDLHRIFASLFGVVEDREVFLVREGQLKTGEETSHPLHFEPGVSSAEFQCTWPGSDIDMVVRGPDGRRYGVLDAVRSGQGAKGRTYNIVRIPDITPGRWNVDLRGVDLAPRGETYHLRVSGTEAPLQVRWKLAPDVPETGSMIRLHVQAEGVSWQDGEVRVWRPDGSVGNAPVALGVGGLGIFFQESGAQQVFALQPDQAGIYRLLATLEGKTRDGHPVTRAFDRTFNVAQGAAASRPRGRIIDFIP